MKVMGYIYHRENNKINKIKNNNKNKNKNILNVDDSYLIKNYNIRKQIILDLCAPKRNIFTNSIRKAFIPQDLLRVTWDNGMNLVDPTTRKGLTAEDYEGFSSVFYILKKLAILGNINSAKNSAGPEDTYICNKSMFDENGKIKPTIVSLKSNLEQLNVNLRDNNQILYRSTIELQDDKRNLYRSNAELKNYNTDLNTSNVELQNKKDSLLKLNNVLNTRLDACDNNLKEIKNDLERETNRSTDYLNKYINSQNILDKKDYDDMHLSGTRLLDVINMNEELKSQNEALETELFHIRQIQDELNRNINIKKKNKKRLKLKRKRLDQDGARNKKIKEDDMELITRKLNEIRVGK